MIGHALRLIFMDADKISVASFEGGLGEHYICGCVFLFRNSKYEKSPSLLRGLNALVLRLKFGQYF